jgi:quercetin dioxygenase-like cupin family protein/quinol monooxygenase YgiN
MKSSIIYFLILCSVSIGARTQEMAKPDYSKMTKGPSDRFVGDVWVDALDSDTNTDFLSSKVYFEPNARSNWHKHTGRQIVFALSGEGYYKEKGKSLRKLSKGDVVIIEPGTIHSHGSLNSRFCQSVTMNNISSENATTWMGKITDQELADTSSPTYTRIAKLVIDPSQLESYTLMLREEIEASVRLEPGVLALRAVHDIKDPTVITIFEIYANKDAYNIHINTPHFLKYKNGSLAMVKALELIDVAPIALHAKPAW